MSTKKSFSIPVGLAKGLRSSIQSATTNQGQLHYDMMSVDVIDLDPLNPRKLLITKDEILTGIAKSDSHYEKKIKEFDALNELANSILQVGIRNAIEVYKDDTRYRIISGERRYLAALIAKQKYIPARINQKVDELKLRYIQWVENINRQDLSLWEKYNNLVTMSVAYSKANFTELNAETIKTLLGVSETQSYRYLSLLNADSDVLELVKQGKINNLKLIEKISSIKNNNLRQQILAEIENGIESSTTTKIKKIKEKNKSKNKTINLGKVRDPQTAKYLIHTILRDAKLIKYQSILDGINWSSVNDINKIFKTLLKVVEKELNANETVDEI